MITLPLWLACFAVPPLLGLGAAVAWWIRWEMDNAIEEQVQED